MAGWNDNPPGADKYAVGDEIGHGAFSEVYSARDKTTGDHAALKHMHVNEAGHHPLHVQRELGLLRAVSHPHVISLLGVHEDTFGVSLALELCLTDLREVLERLERPLSPALAKMVMRQLLLALQAVHGMGYLHRDVAPSNILISREGNVKLSDFGQARQLPSPASSEGAAPNPGFGPAPAVDAVQHAGSLTPVVGTRWYRAPELLFSGRNYTSAVDMWSAACIFAELLSGKPLFSGTSDIDQICRIASVLGSIDEEAWPGVRQLPDWGKLVFPKQLPQALEAVLPGVSPAALHLLRGMLQYNPEHRLTASLALSSSYFSEAPAAAAPSELLHAAQEALARKRRPAAAPVVVAPGHFA